MQKWEPRSYITLNQMFARHLAQSTREMHFKARDGVEEKRDPGRQRTVKEKDKTRGARWLAYIGLDQQGPTCAGDECSFNHESV